MHQLQCHFVHQFRLIRDEPAQAVTVLQVHAQRLGDVHARFLRAIDEDVDAPAAVEMGCLIHHLHHHARAGHHGEADDVGH